MTAIDQRVGEVRADKPGTSGDQRSHDAGRVCVKARHTGIIDRSGCKVPSARSERAIMPPFPRAPRAVHVGAADRISAVSSARFKPVWKSYCSTVAYTRNDAFVFWASVKVSDTGPVRLKAAIAGRRRANGDCIQAGDAPSGMPGRGRGRLAGGQNRLSAPISAEAATRRLPSLQWPIDGCTARWSNGRSTRQKSGKSGTTRPLRPTNAPPTPTGPAERSG